MVEVGWTQAGQVLDGFGALIIALGAVGTGDRDIERSADPGLDEIGDVSGMVLLRQDNQVGGAFLLFGFVGQLIAPYLPTINPEGTILVLTGCIYLGAYLRARRRMAARTLAQIRARLTGRTKNAVVGLAVTFATAL